MTMPDCSAATQCPQCLTGALCDTYIDSCECRPPQADNFCQAGSECIETDNGPQCQDCDEPECYEKGCTVSKYATSSKSLILIEQQIPHS